MDPDDDVIKFIDGVVTCSKGENGTPLSDLVGRQLHSHSQTCKKRGQKICRFNFPQPPMRRTVILYPLDDGMPCVDKVKHGKEFKRLIRVIF